MLKNIETNLTKKASSLEKKLEFMNFEMQVQVDKYEKLYNKYCEQKNEN